MAAESPFLLRGGAGTRQNMVLELRTEPPGGQAAMGPPITAAVYRIVPVPGEAGAARRRRSKVVSRDSAPRPYYEDGVFLSRLITSGGKKK